MNAHRLQIVDFPSVFSLQLEMGKRGACPNAPARIVVATEPFHALYEQLAQLCVSGHRMAVVDSESGFVFEASADGNVLLAGGISAPESLVRALTLIARLGAADLLAVTHSVVGYPYGRIAQSHARLFAPAERRVFPAVDVDDTPIPFLRVSGTEPGQTIVRKHHVILRGIPGNQPFADIANAILVERMRRALRP